MNQEQKEQSSQLKKPKLYRFKLMQGNVTTDGTFEKTKTVGMAYLTDGTRSYSLKLWMLLKDRFYLVPRRKDQTQFLVLTRETNRNPSAKNRSFSNIVGNGQALPALGVVRIDFDLLDKPIYMSMFPESFSHSSRMQEPEVVNEAA